MPPCPVCGELVDADDAAFTHHVNAHFDEVDEPQGGAGDFFAAEPDDPSDTACFICGKGLRHLGETQRNQHVSECLDGGAHDTHAYEVVEDDDDLQSYEAAAGGRKHARDPDWDGAAFAGRNATGSSKKDVWWNPVTGGLKSGDVPPNFSPGVVPILQDLLLQSVASGFTRRAVLSRPCMHIKGAWGFDGTWGCGYRNAMMSISALLLLPSSPYSNHFPEPGVRPIQAWIEESWKKGYDLEGKAQLKGKLVGTAKWVGTSDLYAMFSSMGVPCTLYDFRKPESRDIPSDTPAYKVLERWVKEYFDQDEAESSDSALDTHPVRLSNRLPLILQHQGHSRTIVGYELSPKGEVRLLLFDPGKTVPRDVRDAGLEKARSERSGATAKQASADESSASEPLPKRVTIREGPAAAEPSDDSDVEIRPGGWVRRKVNKAKDKAGKDPLSSSLSTFRTSAKKWGRTQYQVLAFSGGPLLDPAARAALKQVTSVAVDA